MPKGSYPLEVVARWAERSRRGESFISIARGEGVDRRAVARAVRRFEEGARVEEAAGARRTVAADYLREHLSQLQVAARFLLQATAPPSVTGGAMPRLSFQDIEQALVTRLEDWILRDRMGYRVLLPGTEGRSLVEVDQPAYARRLDERAARLQARGIWKGLRNHLPWLEQDLYRLHLAATEADGRERYEELYQELEEKLAPPRLQKELVTSHCEVCPTP